MSSEGKVLESLLYTILPKKTGNSSPTVLVGFSTNFRKTEVPNLTRQGFVEMGLLLCCKLAMNASTCFLKTGQDVKIICISVTKDWMLLHIISPDLWFNVDFLLKASIFLLAIIYLIRYASSVTNLTQKMAIYRNQQGEHNTFSRHSIADLKASIIFKKVFKGRLWHKISELERIRKVVSIQLGLNQEGFWVLISIQQNYLAFYYGSHNCQCAYLVNKSELCIGDQTVPLAYNCPFDHIIYKVFSLIISQLRTHFMLLIKGSAPLKLIP